MTTLLEVLIKRSRKRGYGPPAFVCLACNIYFMQKEDIFRILPLWDFCFNKTILQYSSCSGPACKLNKVWDILDWIKLPRYFTFYNNMCILAYLHTCIVVYLHTCILAFTCILAYLNMHTCILTYLNSCIFAYLHICAM